MPFVMAPSLLLLLLALFSAVPASVAMVRRTGIAQAGLLLASIVLRLISGPVAPPLVVLALALIAEIAVLLSFRPEGRARPARLSPLPPLLALVAIWASFRLLGSASLPAPVALAVVLCGGISILFAPTEGGKRGGLLTSVHGVLLFAAMIPAMGWAGIAMVLIAQAAALALLRSPASASDPELTMDEA